jgi:hypothetical protein
MKNRKTAAHGWVGFRPEASTCCPSPTAKLAQVSVQRTRSHRVQSADGGAAAVGGSGD